MLNLDTTTALRQLAHRRVATCRDPWPAQLAHRRNRRTQRDGHRGRMSWRQAPATAAQLEALRTIATESGHTFAIDVTRGEAWKRIRQATTLLDESVRGRCAPPWYTTR